LRIFKSKKISFQGKTQNQDRQGSQSCENRAIKHKRFFVNVDGLKSE